MAFALDKVALFANLSSQELSFVKRFLISQEYQQNTKIFKKGTIRDKILIITAGQIALQSDIAGQQNIALFKEGDSLGEMTLIRQNSWHQYSLEVATSLVKTLELSAYNWHSIVKEKPQIASKIYQNIAASLKDRLNHANNKLVTLFTTGHIVATYENLDQIAGAILDIIMITIPSQKALFVTYYKTSQKLQICKNIGFKNIKEKSYHRINNDPILKTIVQEPDTLIINHKNAPHGYADTIYKSDTLIITPIKSHQHVIGFIILGNKNNYKDFSINNKILLEAIASQTAPAIEHGRLEELKSAEAEVKQVYIESL